MCKRGGRWVGAVPGSANRQCRAAWRAPPGWCRSNPAIAALLAAAAAHTPTSLVDGRCCTNSGQRWCWRTTSQWPVRLRLLRNTLMHGACVPGRRHAIGCGTLAHETCPERDSRASPKVNVLSAFCTYYSWNYPDMPRNHWGKRDFTIDNEFGGYEIALKSTSL